MTHDLADPRRLKTDLTLSDRDEIRGFAYDLNDPSRRFVVELFADGLPFGLYRADGFVEGLAREGAGDGCYGFAVALPETLAHHPGVLEARLANTGEPVGGLLRTTSPKARPQHGAKTHVHWVAGLRFEGWLEEPRGEAGLGVRALVDGRVVAETVPDGWVHLARDGGFLAARAFHLDLPARLADGRARQVEILAANGTTLAGSPCSFIAFADGIEALVDSHATLRSETMRARKLDHLLAQSWPLGESAAWLDRFPLPLPTQAHGPALGVVMVGEDGIDASLQSLAGQLHCAWTGAALPTRGRATTFETGDLLDFLHGDGADADIVLFCPAGTRFAPSGLGLLRDGLSAAGSARSVYCDLFMPGRDGAWPLLLPAFDYERCLEQGYCGVVFAMWRLAALEAAEAGADSLIRLFDSQFDKPLDAGAEPVHVPLLLATLPPIDAADLRSALVEAAEAHFRSKHLKATITAQIDAGFPMIRVARVADPGKVSIVIPTRNRADLLTTCLTSLEETIGECECEVLIADNDSTDAEALAVMASAARQGIKIVKVPGPFNFSRINNQAVSFATGRYLLLLNNDVEAIGPGWLEEMLGRIAEPDVGAVGPMLLWPSGVVQHAGVVLGPNFSAAYAFGDRMVGDAGYGGLMQSSHECSAVTGACLLTRKDLYLEQGGLDETHFAIDYNDVDYCLKLRAAGYRVILTPHAVLRHAESSTRGRYERPDQRDRYQRELDNLRSKWGHVLAADPYYNPGLTIGGQPYAGLAWPPRPSEPRQPLGLPARPLPIGI